MFLIRLKIESRRIFQLISLNIIFFIVACNLYARENDFYPKSLDYSRVSLKNHCLDKNSIIVKDTKSIKSNRELVLKTIYVSPKGKDSNPGTIDQPLRSFAKAQSIAAKMSSNSKVEVVFLKGTYYLDQTIHLTPKENNITFRAIEEGGAILSGGSLLQLKWELYRKGIYVATIPQNLSIDQLYINGVRQRMARFPNAISGKNVYDTWELSHTIKNDSLNNPIDQKHLDKWENPAGAYLHAMHNLLWGDMHWLIKGKKLNGLLDTVGGWQNNRPSAMHPVYRMVENVFEELDVPGEWFYNQQEKKLYYYPEPITNLKTAKVEVVRLRNLIEFNGNADKPVKGIQLKGFVFKHAARTFMDNKEPLLRSDWTVFRGGAVFFDGAEDCTISDCEFDQVGGNTIFVNNYNRRIAIIGCYIHNSGASGIAFVGDPNAVRSPLFRYSKQNYTTIDRTPGPKSNNFPEDCLVENCLITLTGRDEKQTAPIHISMSHRVRINHCSIYDAPRAGININEGTFGGHIIENCDVFNTVLETGDHGSFNSWGRDRYWTGNANETSTAVEKDPSLPLLDMLDKNIIRNSRWRCDHGWDIDLDDGSTNYEIYNNLLLNRGLKLREGYGRIVTNNIILKNGLHPHVWYRNSGDVFRNNIVFKSYQPAIMNSAIPVDGKWGKELDYNFYVTDKASMFKFIKNGCDSNSINGNPLFINPLLGDFRLQENSLALKLGFLNFDTDHFGVTKPSLKQIAKTPLLPEIKIEFNESGSMPKIKTYSWLNVLLKEPKGEEMSAYGVAFESGGIALTNVDINSEAYILGFKTGDLIQMVNQNKINNRTDFESYLKANGNKTLHHFKLIRNQTNFELLISKNLPNIN
jgi:hypothetical protein